MMKNTGVCLLFIFFLILSPLFSDETEPGIVTQAYYNSELLNRKVGYNIYLPPGYSETDEKYYPVIYRLHGMIGSEYSMNFITEYLDDGIRNGRVPPLIFLYVNENSFSFYSDLPNGFIKSESTIINELIPFIDSEYKTIKNKTGRMIMGFSMGGDGGDKAWICSYRSFLRSNISWRRNYAVRRYPRGTIISAS